MEALETEIGEAAGKIWEALRKGGPMSRAKIAKETGLSNALLNQGIGWLAREGKLASDRSKRVETLIAKE